MFYKFLSGQTFIKNAEGRKASLTLCYPPSHLHHILYELFKNSMRATLETHGGTTCYSELPEIEVMVAKGPCDVSIRISDKVTLKLILRKNALICSQGGGIPRDISDQLFQYMFSTAPRPSMSPTKAPLAGYGYGLGWSLQ